MRRDDLVPEPLELGGGGAVSFPPQEVDHLAIDPEPRGERGRLGLLDERVDEGVEARRIRVPAHHEPLEGLVRSPQDQASGTAGGRGVKTLSSKRSLELEQVWRGRNGDDALACPQPIADEARDEAYQRLVAVVELHRVLARYHSSRRWR